MGRRCGGSVLKPKPAQNKLREVTLECESQSRAGGGQLKGAIVYAGPHPGPPSARGTSSVDRNRESREEEPRHRVNLRLCDADRGAAWQCWQQMHPGFSREK